MRLLLWCEPWNFIVSFSPLGVFLPGMVDPSQCRNKDGALNKPLCLAWSSSGRNHYIALVGIKGGSDVVSIDWEWDCCNSCALAVELLQTCNEPLILSLVLVCDISSMIVLEIVVCSFIQYHKYICIADEFKSNLTVHCLYHWFISMVLCH